MLKNLHLAQNYSYQKLRTRLFKFYHFLRGDIFLEASSASCSTRFLTGVTNASWSKWPCWLSAWDFSGVTGACCAVDLFDFFCFVRVSFFCPPVVFFAPVTDAVWLPKTIEFKVSFRDSDSVSLKVSLVLGGGSSVDMNGVLLLARVEGALLLEADLGFSGETLYDDRPLSNSEVKKLPSFRKFDGEECRPWYLALLMLHRPLPLDGEG